MDTVPFKPLRGHCTCKNITYEVLAPFLCVNCCHCTWCQRETGSAFVLNAIIETSNFRITSGAEPVLHDIQSASGTGQTMARCPTCYVVLYSDYDGGCGKWIIFLRAGTLDDESRKFAKPDAHIYTSTKLDWVDLTGEKERGIPILEEYSDREHVWRKDANERYDLLMQKIANSEKIQAS